MQMSRVEGLGWKGAYHGKSKERKRQLKGNWVCRVLDKGRMYGPKRHLEKNYQSQIEAYEVPYTIKIMFTIVTQQSYKDSLAP